jgi:hypothetical protein
MDPRLEYKFGVRAKGFQVTIAANAANVNLPLAGGAAEFLGLTIVPDNTAFTGATRISLLVNNDQVLDNVPAPFLEDSADNPRSFIPFSRPIQSADEIRFQVNNAAQAVIYVVVYYRQNNPSGL